MFALLIALFSQSVSSLDARCYTVPLTDKIVGGENAAVREFPFLASVRTASTLCGGALISPTWVLTAAHCGTPEWVVMGMWNMSNDKDTCTERLNIKRIIPHPMYNNPPRANDIMLLELDTPSTFQTIKVWNGQGTLANPGTVLTVAGWGTTSDTSMSVSEILQKVNVPIQSNAKCNQQYDGVITDNMLCAGYDQGRQDSCRGDSGGPLFIRDGSVARGFVTVGVVSFGKGCAQASAYGVYTRVTSYFDFICQYSGVCVGPTPQPTPQPTILRTAEPTPFPTPQPIRAVTGRPTPLPTPLPTPFPTPLPTPLPTPVPVSNTITPSPTPRPVLGNNPTPRAVAPTRPPTPCRCAFCFPLNLPICRAAPPTPPPPTTPPPTRPPTSPPSAKAASPTPKASSPSPNILSPTQLLINQLLGNGNNLSPTQQILLQQLLGQQQREEPNGWWTPPPTPQPWWLPSNPTNPPTNPPTNNPPTNTPWQPPTNAPWQPPTNAPWQQPSQPSQSGYTMLTSDGSFCRGAPLSRSVATIDGCLQMCDFTPYCAYAYTDVDANPSGANFQMRWVALGGAPVPEVQSECNLFPAGACEPAGGRNPNWPNGRIYKRAAQQPVVTSPSTQPAGKAKGKQGKNAKAKANRG